MQTTYNPPTQWATYLLMALPIAIVLSPPLSNLLEVGLYGLFLSSSELRQRFNAALKQPIVISGLLLTGFIILSSLWSTANWQVKLDHIYSWRKILLLPIAVALIQTPELKHRFLVIFTLCIGFFAAISWLVYLGDLSIGKLANSLLRNHSTQGMVFFVCILSGGILFIHSKKYSRNFYILLSIILAITITNIFVISTSRSGYLIGLVLTASFAFYTSIKRPWLFFLILATTISAFFVSPTTNQRIQKIWTEVNTIQESKKITSGGARVVFLKNTLPIAKETPIWGHGLKSFPIEYAKQVDNDNRWQNVITRDPHNQYLLLLVEQGIIGLLLFFGFIITCFLQKTENPYKFLGISVLIGWLFTSLFNGHFSSSVEGRFIFLWCAVMLAMPLHQNRKEGCN